MRLETDSISLRPATADDRDFLLTVFASTRTDELAALSANPAQAQAFIEMQFRIQQQDYEARYPAADNHIILVEGQSAGRMLVDRTGEMLALVDIALLSNYRNRGIGSFLIRQLLGEGIALKKAVRLSVFKINPAIRLYDRLGFSVVGDESLYLQMEWSPDSRTSTKPETFYLLIGAENE
jgi:ribosomal protein S18 acetylase RimI-like enzyme